MAIKKSEYDNQDRQNMLIDILCQVFQKKLHDEGVEGMLCWVVSAREKLRHFDQVLTRAILASGEKPGNYDLENHAGRVKYCVEALFDLEREAKMAESERNIAVLIGKAVFVESELRCMEPTCEQ